MPNAALQLVEHDHRGARSVAMLGQDAVNHSALVWVTEGVRQLGDDGRANHWTSGRVGRALSGWRRAGSFRTIRTYLVSIASYGAWTTANSAGNPCPRATNVTG
jgi:hypothetical protein